jgi:hypothetical protein
MNHDRPAGATDPADQPGSGTGTPVPITSPASPAGPPTLTRFRLRGDCVLDFPLVTRPHCQLWAATVWVDHREPSGWARRFWEAGQTRGFIPSMVDLGDIIQFSVQHAPAVFTKWNGYLHAINRDSLLIHGPYPTLPDAHAAAQLALVHQIHAEPSFHQDPRVSTGIELPTSTPPAATSIAQPPATVSVTFHGPHATIGDPLHGWIIVDTAPLLAAMAHPSEHLAGLLREHVTLGGDEAPVVLAALAASHLPQDLPPPTMRPTSLSPAAPTSAPHVTDPSAAASTRAESPASSGAEPSAFIWAPPDPFFDGSL